MIILAATLVAILVGTAYHAGAGFWKKPRLAMVTFVSLFVPAVVFLPLSGWKFPLIEWSSGWAYLILLYLVVHLAGLLAYFWALVAERTVRLFHKVKVGLMIFLGAAAVGYVLVPYIVMGDEAVLWIITGLILIAIVVPAGLRLFRILREKLADWKEKRKAAKDRAQASRQAQETRSPQDQPQGEPAAGWPPKDQSPQGRTTETRSPEDRTTQERSAQDQTTREDQSPQDQPQSKPPESHPEDGKTAAERLKDLMKNVRVRPDLKVRFEDLRPRISQGLKIDNLRLRIPWSVSIEDIGAPAKKLFGRLRRTIRDRSGKPKEPSP